MDKTGDFFFQAVGVCFIVMAVAPVLVVAEWHIRGLRRFYSHCSDRTGVDDACYRCDRDGLGQMSRCDSCLRGRPPIKVWGVPFHGWARALVVSTFSVMVQCLAVSSASGISAQIVLEVLWVQMRSLGFR